MRRHVLHLRWTLQHATDVGPATLERRVAHCREVPTPLASNRTDSSRTKSLARHRWCATRTSSAHRHTAEVNGHGSDTVGSASGLKEGRSELGERGGVPTGQRRFDGSEHRALPCPAALRVWRTAKGSLPEPSHREFHRSGSISRIAQSGWAHLGWETKVLVIDRVRRICSVD